MVVSLRLQPGNGLSFVFLRSQIMFYLWACVCRTSISESGVCAKKGVITVAQNFLCRCFQLCAGTLLPVCYLLIVHFTLSLSNLG